MSPDAALDVCRFLHDGSAMLLWGASAYLAFLVPPKLAVEVARRLKTAGLAAATLAVVTTALTLPLELAMIGDGWSDAVRPATVGEVLFDTSVGSAWLVQAVAALLLVATLAIAPGRRRPAVVVTSGLLLAGLASTGHAVMHSGWLGVAHRINDAIHVLAAGAWLGALVPLVLLLAALGDPRRSGEAVIAIWRFSFAGQFMVALIVASGVANTMLVLGHPPTDWSSPYEALLAAKLALVMVMIALATVNRFAFVPHISGEERRPAGAIRLGAVMEILLGLGVVALVAVFGMLEPA